MGVLYAGQGLGTSVEVLPELIDEVENDERSSTTTSTTSSNQQHYATVIAAPPQYDLGSAILGDDDLTILASYLGLNPVKIPITGVTSITPPPSSPTSPSSSPSSSLNPNLKLSSATCYPGGSAMRYTDVSNSINTFCTMASQNSWSITAGQAGSGASFGGKYLFRHCLAH